MSDITVTFKNETILAMDASGSKPLLTQGKYCEDDISITYAKPTGPTGTKQISITQNGTTTEDVAAYANAEITVNVQGGGGSSMQSGSLTLASDIPNAGELIISLDGTVTSFVFYVSTFPSSLNPTDGWQTVGGVWLNGYGWAFVRYNDANYSASQGRQVTVTASTLSFNVQYKIPAGTVINWFAW